MITIIVLSGPVSGATIRVTGVVSESQTVTVNEIIFNVCQLPIKVGETITLGEQIAGPGEEPCFTDGYRTGVCLIGGWTDKNVYLTNPLSDQTKSMLLPHISCVIIFQYL